MIATCLGDVADIDMGQAPPGESYNDEQVGLPLIAGASDFGELTPEPSRYTNAPTKRSREGDIILCIRATIGDLNWSDREYCLGRGVAGIRPRGGAIEARYLWRLLEANAQRLRALGRGATFKQISRSDVETLDFALPPVEEQKRIAVILDQADELRRLRRRAVDRLNDLGRAIFQEMFTGGVSRETKQLSEIADLINGDRSSNYPSGEDVQEDGILFLSTKNIQNWQLSLEKAQYISEAKFASLSRGKLRRGDIVITLRGTLGQAALFDCKQETGFINAQMMIIRTKQGVFPEYLLDFIALDSTQRELRQGQSGSAVRQLTAKQVGMLPVVIPSLEEQHEYLGKSAQVRSLANGMLRKSAGLDALFASVQDRAFRGEL